MNTPEMTIIYMHGQIPILSHPLVGRVGRRCIRESCKKVQGSYYILPLKSRNTITTMKLVLQLIETFKREKITDF